MSKTETTETNDMHNLDKEIFCPFTSMYCIGEFCDDCGCAKEAGCFDGEGDDL